MVSALSEDDKVQLKIWVSKRTDKRVRAYIAQKYNMHVKGLLSFEGEQLLIDGLDSKDKRGKGNFYETKAHTHVGTNLCSIKGQKAEQLIDAILTWFMKEYNQSKPPTDIPHEILRKGIVAIAGVQDSRSIKSRIELLKANGMIKGPNIDTKLYVIPCNIIETPPPKSSNHGMFTIRAVDYIYLVSGTAAKTVEDAAGRDMSRARELLDSLHKKITYRVNT